MITQLWKFEPLFENGRTGVSERVPLPYWGGAWWNNVKSLNSMCLCVCTLDILMVYSVFKPEAEKDIPAKSGWNIHMFPVEF